MAAYINGRRQFLILLFILLFIFACATYSMSEHTPARSHIHCTRRSLPHSALDCHPSFATQPASRALTSHLSCPSCIVVVLVDSNLYLQWIVLASGLAVLIIVDFMFLSADTFVYDPSYKSWAIKTGQQM